MGVVWDGGVWPKVLLIAAPDNNEFIIMRPIQMGPTGPNVVVLDEWLATLYHCQAAVQMDRQAAEPVPTN